MCVNRSVVLYKSIDSFHHTQHDSLWMYFRVAFNISYTPLPQLSLWLTPGCVPIQRFQSSGDYVAHTEDLSISNCQCWLSGYWLQLWILVFVITVFIFVAQWKGCLKVGPVKGCEGNCLVVFISLKTFLSYSFASSGTCHFKARQSRVFDKFTTTHCFLICLFNINWIPDHCITPLNSMHNASSVQCCNS